MGGRGGACRCGASGAFGNSFGDFFQREDDPAESVVCHAALAGVTSYLRLTLPGTTAVVWHEGLKTKADQAPADDRDKPVV